MKIFIMYALLILAIKCQGQIKIDKNLALKFDNQVNKLDSNSREIVLSKFDTNNDDAGIAIFTEFKIDTLNLSDLDESHKNGIIIINPDSGIEQSTDENVQLPYPDLINAKLENGSLRIFVGFLNPTINIMISENFVESYYEEYLKNDSVFQLDLNEAKVSNLKIPIKTKQLLLSEPKFKVGDTLYGFIEFKTEPYYSYFNANWFKNKYIHQTVEGSFVFKVVITE